MKKILLLTLMTVFACVASPMFSETNKSFLETVNPRFQGIDLTLGQYELGLAPIFTFSDWDFLMVKVPVLRWNPFNVSLNLGLVLEYFPLRQFGLSWWIFGKDGIQPFVYSGLQVPISFQSLTVPIGIGLQGRIVEAFYLSARVFLNLSVVPVVYPAFSWEVALEYKALKF